MPVGDYSELDEFRGPLSQPEAAGARRVVQVNSSDVLISPTATELIAANPEFVIASGGGIVINASPILGGTDKRLFFQDGTVTAQSANLTYDKVTDVFTTGAATTVVIPYVTSITADWAYGVIGDLDQFIGGFGTPTLGATNAATDAYLNITEGESVGYTHKHPVMKGGVRVEQADGTTTYYESTADTDAARGVALQAALDAVKALADADGATGFAFVGPLTYVAVDSDNGNIPTFYGVATYGGTSHTTKGGNAGTIVYTSYEGWTNGVVFRFDTGDPQGSFEVLHAFTNTEIWNPQCGLVEVTVGGVNYMYGVGGEVSAGASYGAVWRIRKSNGAYSVVQQLTPTTGFRPYGTPLKATDNNLYFTCSWSGDGTDNDQLGTICKVDPAAGTLTKVATFVHATVGSNPNSGLAQGANIGGQLAFYGTCARGGSSDFGTVYRYLVGTGIQLIYTFTGTTDGFYPIGQILYDAGTLVGTTKMGGTNGYGSVFKVTGVAAGGVGTYTANIVAFTGTSGSYQGMHPVSGLIKSSDGDYYGATMEGGPQNAGVIYSLDVGLVADTCYGLVVYCNKLAGYYPRCNLTEVGANFWFTTQLGGVNHSGDVCSVPRSGSDVANLQVSAAGGNANCKIILGPGTYTIEPYRITFGNFTLEGAGKLVTTIKCEDDTWYKGLFGGTWSFLSTWSGYMSSPSGVHLKNLTVDANVGGQAIAINAQGVPTGATTAGNCSFGGYDAYASDSSVENVMFINLGGTMDVGQQIYGCWFTNAGGAGLYFYRAIGTHSHGISQGNRIINCDSRHPFPNSVGIFVCFRNGGDNTDSDLEVGNGWALNPIISGCTADDYDTHAGGSIFGFSGQATAGLVINDCAAYNLGDPAVENGRGIQIDNHPQLDTLITNLRTDKVGSGIRLDLVGGNNQPQTRVTIVNCQLRATNTGIYLNAVTPQLRIVNNQIVAPLGIDSLDRSSTGVDIRGNMIDASTTAIDTDAWATPAKRFGNRTAAGVPLDTKLDLSGSSSGVVTIQTAAAAGTYTLTLPTTDGTANQFLQTDGSGILTWAAGGGAVEGTAVLSTGEVGGTKFLREDGDGTCSWQTISGGGDALVANPLSQFAATTSLQLKGVISDETGSGVLVFGTSPEITTSLTTGSATFALLNTTATTVNAFGAATTLNIGASATCILNFGGSTTASEFRFLEPSGSGTNYTAFKAKAQGASITYTLPDTVGGAGTFLKDAAGDGVLSWAAASGGGLTVGTSTIASGTDTGVFFQDGASPTGVFAQDSGFTYNKTTNVLTVAGHYILTTSGMGTGGTGAHIGADASGRFNFSTSGSTDIGILVPGSTSTAVITLPSATGTLATLAGSEALSGKTITNSSIGSSNPGSGAFTTLSASGTITLTGVIDDTLNGAVSAPAAVFRGTWYSGGSATTTRPQFLVEPTGTTASGWSTSGTGLGVNAANAFAGNLIDLQLEGVSKFNVSSAGAATHPGTAPQIILGVNTTTLGSIKMFGNTSGSITLSPASVAGGTLTQTLPAISGVLGIKQPRILTFMVDGGGSAITTGLGHGVAVCPVAGAITAWGIGVDTGTATVKLCRVATGTAIPTTGDNLNSAGVAISTGTYVRSTTVTDFSVGVGTAITANDIFSLNVTVTSGPTWLTFWVEITPTN